MFYRSFSSLDVRLWIGRRLVPVLLAVAFAFGLSVVSDARAASFPPQSFRAGGSSGSFGSSTLTACQAYSVATTGSSAGVGVQEASDGSACVRGTTFFTSVWGVCADGAVVAYNSTNLATPCSTIPAPTCAQDKGKVVNTDHYTVSSPSKLVAGVDVCIPVPNTSGGCSFSASGRAGGYDKVTGKWEYQFMGPLTHSGNVCTGNGVGATDPVKNDSPTKCGAGMCTGTVNGVEVCVRCAQTDTANNATKTTTNPDGSTTQVTTNTNTTINNNNATTTTTTTTTTTPAGGGTPTTTTKTDTTNETKDSYCQRNPSDAGCKELDGQASGGDTCDAPPVCTGDAIQCMLVQQQYKTRCELQKTDEVSEFGNKLANGEDPDADKLPTPGKASEINLKDQYALLDNMGVIPQCLPDVRINMPGVMWLPAASLTISTEPLCEHGKLLGMLNIMATLIVCAYMLKGSF